MENVEPINNWSPHFYLILAINQLKFTIYVKGWARLIPYCREK